MMQAYVHLPDIKWGRNFLGAKNCRETDLSELFPTQFVPKVKSRWARVSRYKEREKHFACFKRLRFLEIAIRAVAA